MIEFKIKSNKINILEDQIDVMKGYDLNFNRSIGAGIIADFDYCAPNFDGQYYAIFNQLGSGTYGHYDPYNNYRPVFCPSMTQYRPKLGLNQHMANLIFFLVPVQDRIEDIQRNARTQQLVFRSLGAGLPPNFSGFAAAANTRTNEIKAAHSDTGIISSIAGLFGL